MRNLALLAVLLLTGGCTMNGSVAEDGSVPFRTVASAAYAANTETRAVTAFDADTYRALWDELVGSGTPPAVDFPSESAVLLFAGQRPTGGYSYEVHSARIEGRMLVVEASVKGPPRGAIVTMALTSPYVVIAVKARGFETVVVHS